MPFSDERSQYFPYEVVPGITVEAVSSEELYAVTGRLSDQVFSPLESLGLMPFRAVPSALSEQYRRHTEHFVFYDAAGQPVGWSTGEQRQGDDFFMTWSGILPEWQRRGLYGAFLGRLKSYLGALGYRRLTSNHHVNNRAVLIAKLKAGFLINALTLDERFGAVVWLAYYFEPTDERGFERAFSLEPRL